MTNEDLEQPYFPCAPLDLAKMTWDDRQLALKQLKERAVLEWRYVENQISHIKPLPVLDFGQFERKEERLSRLRAELLQWEMAGLCFISTDWPWGYVEAAESAQVSNQTPSIKALVDESPKPHPWIATAREIGEKWMEEQESKTGKNPSIVKIAQHVEGELARREIRGPQGKFLHWETIKKDALKGITGRSKNGGLVNVTGGPQ